MGPTSPSAIRAAGMIDSPAQNALRTALAMVLSLRFIFHFVGRLDRGVTSTQHSRPARLSRSDEYERRTPKPRPCWVQGRHRHRPPRRCLFSKLEDLNPVQSRCGSRAWLMSQPKDRPNGVRRIRGQRGEVEHRPGLSPALHPGMKYPGGAAQAAGAAPPYPASIAFQAAASRAFFSSAPGDRGLIPSHERPGQHLPTRAPPLRGRMERLEKKHRRGDGENSRWTQGNPDRKIPPGLDVRSSSAPPAMQRREHGGTRGRGAHQSLPSTPLARAPPRGGNRACAASISARATAARRPVTSRGAGHS